MLIFSAPECEIPKGQAGLGTGLQGQQEDRAPEGKGRLSPQELGPIRMMLLGFLNLQVGGATLRGAQKLRGLTFLPGLVCASKSGQKSGCSWTQFGGRGEVFPEEIGRWVNGRGQVGG